MDVVSGTDTPMTSAADSVLAGVRRLTSLADGARDADAVFRALARELLLSPGAEEVHVHYLSEDANEFVSVYMFEGDGRLSYMLPRTERPPGISWVANTGRSVLIADGEELLESVPRLGGAGRDQLGAADAADRARRGQLRRDARAPALAGLRRGCSRARADARRPGGHSARARAGARRGGHGRRRRLHEPPRDAATLGRGDRPRDAHRQPALVHLDRPRRLQAGQRRIRPPSRGHRVA